MPVSADFIYNATKSFFNGTASPYTDALKYVALKTSPDSIPTNPQPVLADVELAFPDQHAVGATTIQPYVDSTPPYDAPGPITIDEILPYCEYPTPDSWHNGTSDPITVGSLAIISGDKILFWGAPVAPTTINPGDDYAPAKGIVTQIVGYTGEGVRPAVHASTDAIMVYLRVETANHRLAANHIGSGVPDRLKWGDLIVNDPHIGRDFRDMCEQLERLMFVLDGAVCEDGNQWYLGHNPRCNWFAEQWEEVWCGTSDIGGPICGARYYGYHEYVAEGLSSNGIPVPTTPRRSKSGQNVAARIASSTGDPYDKANERYGDHQMQAIDGSREHDRTHFPKLSVTRYAGAEVFDPQGSGSFGGDPSAIGTDGPVSVTGEGVLITYTCPSHAIAEQCDPVNTGYVKLTYNGTTVSMTRVGDTYTYTIPIQPHDTEVLWYVEAKFHPTSGPDVVRFEPGNESAPDDDNKYAYTAFTHYVRYEHGLPSFYQSKDTDKYTFAGDETIQYELINMVRFALDYIGAAFNFAPSLRSSIPVCCLLLSIRWRWSGSNKFPLHQNGGKDGVKPLHNMDDLGSSTAYARRSWRGYPYQYAGNFYFPSEDMNASFASPGTHPIATFNNIVGPLRVVDDECVITWAGEKRGLYVDDVFEPVHIRELISAVDLLLSGGLWNKCAIKRRPVTPGGDCGKAFATAVHTVMGVPTYVTSNTYCPSAMCFNGCSDQTNPDPTLWTCEAFTAPSWADCQGMSSQVCRVSKFYNKHCSPKELPIDDAPGYRYSEGGGTACLGGTGSYSDGCGTITGCDGTLSGAQGGAILWSCDLVPSEGPSWTHVCETEECSWRAFVCGPKHNPLGPDDSHGNSRIKPRYDHTCPDPDLAGNSVAFSLGNKFGDTYICGTNIGTGGHSIPFEEVTDCFLGGWDNYAHCQPGLCDGTCPHYDDPDPPTGTSSWWNWADPAVYGCADSYTIALDGDTPFEYTGVESCQQDLAGVCDDDMIWCSVDLNLTEADENGKQFPQLYDYDLGSENLVTTCACETIANPTGCI